MTRHRDAVVDRAISEVLGKETWYLNMKAPFSYNFWVTGYPFRFILTTDVFAKLAYHGISDQIAKRIRPHLERYDREKSERTT